MAIYRCGLPWCPRRTERGYSRRCRLIPAFRHTFGEAYPWNQVALEADPEWLTGVRNVFSGGTGVYVDGRISRDPFEE